MPCFDFSAANRAPATLASNSRASHPTDAPHARVIADLRALPALKAGRSLSEYETERPDLGSRSAGLEYAPQREPEPVIEARIAESMHEISLHAPPPAEHLR